MAWCCSGSPKKAQAIQRCQLVPCLAPLGYNPEPGIALLRLCFVLGTDLTGGGCACDFTQQSCRTGVFISTYLSQYSIIPELLYLFSQYLIEKWLRNTEKILVIIEISIEYCYWYSTLEDSYHSEVIFNPVICFHKMEARGYELISYDLETLQIQTKKFIPSSEFVIACEWERKTLNSVFIAYLWRLTHLYKCSWREFWNKFF